MTEVTVKVDNNNPDTVTVNGVEYERKIPAPTLEERVIAEVDKLGVGISAQEEEKYLCYIGYRLTDFYRYENKRDEMLHICLYARQIFKLKGVEVKGIGEHYLGTSQKELTRRVGINLIEYHHLPTQGYVTNIYYAALRWLMNDLESNTK